MNVKTQPALTATLSPTLEATITRTGITLIRGTDRIMRISNMELDKLIAARAKHRPEPDTT